MITTGEMGILGNQGAEGQDGVALRCRKDSAQATGIGIQYIFALGFGLIRKCFATGHFMWMPVIDARFSRPLREAKCILW